MTQHFAVILVREKQKLQVKQKIQASFAKQNGALSDKLHMADGLPIPVCHLTNRIGRKVLAHTVGMMVNKILGNPPLQFEHLILFKNRARARSRARIVQ